MSLVVDLHYPVDTSRAVAKLHYRAQERGAFADVLPRLHWDTASAFSDPVLHMLRSVTGLGNDVFGTDYP